MGDSLPRQRLNHRSKFDAAIALSSLVISITIEKNKKQTVNGISAPCLSAYVDRKKTYFV